MDLKELQLQRDDLLRKLKCNCRKLQVVTQMKCDLETLVSSLRSKYHKIDHELALRDGRLIRLREDGRIASPAKAEKELLKIMELPLCDRLAIANALKDLQEGLLQ